MLQEWEFVRPPAYSPWFLSQSRWVQPQAPLSRSTLQKTPSLRPL